jgi:Ser/Thr protein kinase RdoA (MazF antagonist)
VLPTRDGPPGAWAATRRRAAARRPLRLGAGPRARRVAVVEDFRALGAIAARLHEHARRWRRPAWFTRFTWGYETSIGPRGHWGRWQDGMAVGPPEREVLGRLEATLQRRLAAFGDGPDRFGLVHADMRLANLIVDGPPGPGSAPPPSGHAGPWGPARPSDPAGPVHVIDFDDCGFGWYLYDLGSSLSFLEDDPRVPELTDAWVTGYREVGRLSAREEAELPTFVLLRRLLLVAWIGSHADTDLAQQMGADFTRGCLDLAEAYLSRFG